MSISTTLSPHRPKDTRENILATRQFVVNIISEPFIEAANSTSVEAPAEVDEWIIAGLNEDPSVSNGCLRARGLKLTLDPSRWW